MSPGIRNPSAQQKLFLASFYNYMIITAKTLKIFFKEGIQNTNCAAVLRTGYSLAVRTIASCNHLLVVMV